MRIVQYVDQDMLRCAVLLAEGGEGAEVSGLPPPAGFAEAIQTARSEDRPLTDLMRELAERSTQSVRLDLAHGRVHRLSETLPLAVPIRAPEIWAAGVTYLQSRTAREYESGEMNRAVYSRVYAADRPEIFLKDADCRRTVAAERAISLRGDSSWTVPEPELALILDSEGHIVAYTIGNDVSARDIEAENPLYLPQAKIYRYACALGPVALLAEDEAEQSSFDIELVIRSSEGDTLFKGSTSTAQMKRRFGDLVSYLLRYNSIADGTVLLTGTGVVPPDDFSLEEGQIVEITVSGIGLLRNQVRRLVK